MGFKQSWSTDYAAVSGVCIIGYNMVELFFVSYSGKNVIKKFLTRGTHPFTDRNFARNVVCLY